MNKNDFIKELSNKTGLDEEKCKSINGILENTFIIGRKNKDTIISEIVSKLGIDQGKADEIYNQAMQIIGNGIKDKLKNPFKSQD